jgi:general secretion pathway protein E
MAESSSMPRLGQLLVELGWAQQAEVDRALALQAQSPARIGEILVRLGAVSEESLYRALARQTGVELLDEENWPAAAALTAGLERSQLPAAWWERQAAMPWLGPDERLCVALTDPLSAELRETAAARGWEVAGWCLLLPAQLERWQALAAEPASLAGEFDARALRELAEDAPVISYVNGLLAQAVEARASDVHIEPGEQLFKVRMRIDGVLHDRQVQPMSRYPAVASRVKLVSALDIAERRLPQDGRTSIRVAGSEMDLRVSVMPAVHGESIVMRLLPKRRGDLSLDRLGMQADHLALFRGWLGWPNGLVLVTGPTGSGKSTTLYGALHEINSTQRKVITVEDPVELQVPHVVQIQTQVEIGYTFARALRSILRHDPDIIMVGEIRDRETAEIAVQAALTGHLVLATLHTNDALSAVTRLVDMGIEPYLVAASLRAVMAQRLVRQLCEACAVEEPRDALAASQARPAHERWGQGRAMRPRAAKGCARCQDTGFRGRIAIYELVEVTAALQQLVTLRASVGELEAAADRAGRRSLYQDGLLKVADGRTTLAEVATASLGTEPQTT